MDPVSKPRWRRSSDTWSLNGHVVDPAPVWGTLGVVAHLRADDFVDLTAHPDWAADKLTYASVILQLKDGSGTSLVRIGRQDPASKHYPVSINKDPTVYAVAENTIKGILRKPSEFKPSPSVK